MEKLNKMHHNSISLVLIPQEGRGNKLKELVEFLHLIEL